MSCRIRIILVSLILSVTSAFAQSISAETLRAMNPGRRVQVILQNGDKITGKLGAITPTGFTLQGDSSKQPSQEFQYSEVRTVHKKMARSTKWIIAGGVYGALVAIGAILGD